EPVEPFRLRRRLESLGRCADGDLGNARSANTLAIATGALAGARGKDVADGGSAPSPARLDQRGAVRDGRVDVVHDDGLADCARFVDGGELALLRIAPVTHQVLADVSMRAGEPGAVEARLPGAREADQDHQLWRHRVVPLARAVGECRGGESNPYGLAAGGF